MRHRQVRQCRKIIMDHDQSACTLPGDETGMHLEVGPYPDRPKIRSVANCHTKQQSNEKYPCEDQGQLHHISCHSGHDHFWRELGGGKISMPGFKAPDRLVAPG